MLVLHLQVGINVRELQQKCNPHQQFEMVQSVPQYQATTHIKAAFGDCDVNWIISYILSDAGFLHGCGFIVLNAVHLPERISYKI